MPYEAKLEGDVRVFRFVPCKGLDFPKRLKRRLLDGHRSIFLFHLKSADDDDAVVAAATTADDDVPVMITFDSSALSKRDFHSLAIQLMFKLRKLIAPKSRDLLAKRIADYLHSCFHFCRCLPDQVSPSFHYPALIFLASISLLPDVDVDVDENDDNFHCFYINGPLDDADHTTTQTQSNPPNPNNVNNLIINYNDYHDHYSSNNNNNNIIAAPDYQSLEVKDAQILRLWFAQLIKGGDIGQLQLQQVQSSVLAVKPMLQLLPSSKSKSDDDDDDVICSICLGELSTDNEGNTNTMLVCCKHVFHTRCLFQWLPNRPSCPCCRSSTLTPLLIY